MSQPSSGPQPSADPQPRAHRRFGLLLALTVMVSASSSGATILVLGDRISSQAEAVANAEFRAAAPVIVPVERKKLSEAFTFRATLDRSTQKDLRLTPGIEGVVTSVPLKANGTVRAGSVVLEVQGRPVIALPGRFRAYRTIKDGDTGPDVEQLQTALRSLGYRSADRKGTYGSSTQNALGRLYRALGWEPPYREEPAAVDEVEGDGATNASDPDSSAATKTPPRRRTIEARQAELFIISGLPRRADAVPVRVGQSANGSETVLSRYTESTRLKGNVPGGRSDAAVEGTAVRVDVGGKVVTGRLVANTATTVDAQEGASDDADTGSDDSGGGLTVTVLLDDRRPIDAGRSYKVTVEGKHTDGPVLAVPLTAVNERPDGTAFVSTQQEQGKLVDTEVTPGIQADGWVEITPRSADALSAGTPVIVGGKDVAK